MMQITHDEIKAIIAEFNGTIDGGINWTWATFANDVEGQMAYARIAPYVESRGYCPACPESTNSNLHRGGFRFR